MPHGAEMVTNEELRSIIHNAHKIKKDHVCQRCRGTGHMNWNGETGDDEKPGKLANYDDDIRTDGVCEKCWGIGYIDIFIYSDED